MQSPPRCPRSSNGPPTARALYVANLTFTHFYTCAGTPYHGEANVSMIEGNKITDRCQCTSSTPQAASISTVYAMMTKPTDSAAAASSSQPTPTTPPYYLSSIVAGVFVVRDGELVNIINSSNTLYTKGRMGRASERRRVRPPKATSGWATA